MRWLVLAFLAVPAVSAQDTSPLPPATAIVARVGEVEITGADLAAEYNRLIPLNFFHSNVPPERVREVRRQALEIVIEKTLIHSDAIERGIAVSEDELRAKFAEALTLAGPQYASLSAEEWEVTFEQYRPLTLRRVLLDKNEARFENDLPAIAEEAVRARFDELTGTLLTPERARFRHILVKVPPSASSQEAGQLHDKMKSILDRLAAGDSFESLARELSEDIYAEAGGDMGFVGRGSFRKTNVDEAAFALADGEVSEILTTIYGYHLVQRLETQQRRALTFEQAHDDLRDDLNSEQASGARRAWLDELSQRYGVERLDLDSISAE